MNLLKRRERRKSVTLIAGLVCGNSLIFAADSEQSGLMKSSVEKISHSEPLLGALGLMADPSQPTPVVVVAGAGNGVLADYASQRIIDETGYLATKVAIEEKIREILEDIFRNHVPLHPRPQDAELELLIGVKPPDYFRPILYSTEGITLVKRRSYHVCGSGTVVDYILDQIYETSMTVEDGISAALFMLQVAKSYVDGVGGDSHITVLMEDGRIDSKPSWEITEEENLAKQYTRITGKLLLAAFRNNKPDSDGEFDQALAEFSTQVMEIRQKKKKSDLVMQEYLEQVLDSMPEDSEEESENPVNKPPSDGT